jgi:RNA polymerase sigma-70 factor (ECF subfamily)
MKITEDNFIFNLSNKNEKALEYVIDQYGWLVKAIIQKHLYNLVDYQQECINDVFLGIWNNIDSFDPSKNTFKNWVAGITKYKTIDYRRKYLKYLQQEDVDTLEIADEQRFDNELLKHELDKDLEELLNCLKSQDKELFLKLYVEEQDIELVSKQMGLKKAVIYNRLSRGKLKLKENWSILERRV